MEKRAFSLGIIEDILRFSSERYYDVGTGRTVVIGKHREQLVLIPYEIVDEKITPVTVHATTRQQIKFRTQSGRFIINV